MMIGRTRLSVDYLVQADRRGEDLEAKEERETRQSPDPAPTRFAQRELCRRPFHGVRKSIALRQGERKTFRQILL